MPIDIRLNETLFRARHLLEPPDINNGENQQ